MKSGWGRKLAAGVTWAAGFGISVTAAFAQEAEVGGLSITADVEFGIEIDDNGDLQPDSDGTDTIFFTDLSLVTLATTPTQSLSFGLAGRVQQENLASGTERDGFVDPLLTLDYTLEGPDSTLDIEARYRETDVSDFLSLDLDGDLIDDLFLSSEGELERLDYSVRYRFRETAPIGGEIFLSRRERRYTDVVSPDLFDSDTDRARLTLFVRPRQTLEFRTFVEIEEYDAEDVDDTERETLAYGVGVDYQITPIWSFDGEIAFEEVEERDLGGLEENDGVALAFAVTRDMRNGEIAFFGDRRVFTDVTRTSLGVRRALEFPAGDLSFSVALSDSDEGDLVVLAGFDYERAFPSGLLNASLEQTASVDDSDDEFRRSRLTIDYTHELTPTAALDVGLRVVQTEDIGLGTVTEGTRADLTVAYRQRLTEDWDWAVGYEAEYRKTEGGRSAQSNSVFATIGRSFSIRP